MSETAHEQQKLFAQAMAALRKGLSSAGAHELAATPTQDLLAALDRPYRAMVAAQRALAALTGRTAQQAEGDFYSLAVRVYRGLPQDSLCGACHSVVPSAGACPFCGAILGEPMEPKPVKAGAARPVQGKGERGRGVGALPEAAENRGTATPPALPPPTISPGTPLPDVNRKRLGASAKGGKRGPRRFGRTNPELAQYARRVDICRQFPYSGAYLRSVDIIEVRQIAAACLDGEERKKGRSLIRKSKDQLISWVLCHQPDRPKDPGPPKLAKVRRGKR